MAWGSIQGAISITMSSSLAATSENENIAPVQKTGYQSDPPLNQLWVAIAIISVLAGLFLAFGLSFMGAIGMINPPLWTYGVLQIPAIILGCFSIYAFKKA